VVVIGHTDRVGNDQYNDRLSLQRAERVRGELVRLGIPESRIRTAGRGEREPLVATDDEVPEPRNRRVEINVR
jgi:outer membrane protein OmpA-like peptidoglycan-associated protein